MKTTVLKRGEEVVIPDCRVATDFVSRFLGLMGKRGIGSKEAIVFPKCNSVHTFFMRFPIDIVMVSASGEVVATVEKMRAWRMLMPRLKAKHTIELQAGQIGALGIRIGQSLQCEGAWG